MKTCSTCKYWDVRYSVTGYTPLYLPSTLHGQCLKALTVEGIDHTDDDSVLKDAPMIALDGSAYFSVLLTHPTHGCDGYEEMGIGVTILNPS